MNCHFLSLESHGPPESRLFPKGVRAGECGLDSADRAQTSIPYMGEINEDATVNIPFRIRRLHSTKFNADTEGGRHKTPIEKELRVFLKRQCVTDP
jgi:hypothetical protein